MYKYTQKNLCRFACVIFIFLVSMSFTGCDDSKIITGTTKIDSLEWTAIAEIQELKTCDESGWEVPEGAIVYKEQEEIKSFKIVGYETKYRVEEYQELVAEGLIGPDFIYFIYQGYHDESGTNYDRITYNVLKKRYPALPEWQKRPTEPNMNELIYKIGVLERRAKNLEDVIVPDESQS